MKIDKTTQVDGGGLVNMDLETGDLHAELTPQPAELSAVLSPTTVSITHLYIDSFDTGAPDPGPGPGPDPEDPTLFYGRPSILFGFGGAPPYLTCYPLSGTYDGDDLGSSQI